MRRADRLFQIIQILRGARAPVTGGELAEELETSLRTIYRDIAELMAQRVPIRGEAGIGYVLERGYDMPPLMLTPDEIEAAVLGALWVRTQGDPALDRGARDLITKINAVIPEDLRPLVLDDSVMVPRSDPLHPDAIDMRQVRAWIRRRGKIRITYRTEGTRTNDRVIWPIAIAYFSTARLIVAWCELRQDFRNFRTDRIAQATFLDDTHSERIRVLRAQWRQREGERSKDYLGE